VAFLILAVLGAIVFGIATPTEAAASGAFGSMIVAAIYRRLTPSNLTDASRRTVGTMGMFGGVILGAMCFTAIFSGLGGKQMAYNLIMGLDVPPLVILIVVLGAVFLMGMFLDPVPILLILIPTMVPIAEAMEWNQLWFGMLVCITMQTAWLSPPFGYALFFLRGLNLPGITFTHIAIGAIPFILLQVTGVGLCIAFPNIILWLPNLFIK
jgi:TRAP-type mannitol/chloroaromatic compound transport system permease large subunit